MKKSLSIIALAALAFVGCSKVTPESPKTVDAKEKDVPIEFNAVNYLNTTKALSSGTTFYTGGKFGIYSVFSGNDFTTVNAADAAMYFDNKEVARFTTPSEFWAINEFNGGNRISYYWPKSGKLSFFAYFPKMDSGVALANDGKITFSDYTVASNITAQADNISDTDDYDNNDLMIADAVTNKEANHTGGTTDKVSLTFRHKLAKIKFSAKMSEKATINDDLQFKIVVKSINVTKFGTKADYNGSAWGSIKNSNDEIAAMDSGDFEEEEIVGGTAAGNDFANDATALEKNTYKVFGNALYVMPQTLSDDTTVQIKYDVYAVKTSTSKIISLTENTKTVALKNFKSTQNSITAWEINKIYNYRFTIDAFADEILFDPKVVDWDNVDSDEYKLN